MKNNKLLLTTALATSLVGVNSNLNAQTTITGDLAVIYSAASIKNSSLSNRGFGRESQINVQNKGKLNNGIDYAAGFALEFDGPGTSAGSNTGAIDNSISNENLYFDFLFGPTTFTIGIDHKHRGYASTAPQVYSVIDLVHASNTGSGTTFVLGGAVGEAMGLGLSHNFMGLTASAHYVPRLRDTGGQDVAAIPVNVGANSAYEVGISGSPAAMKALTLKLFHSSQEKQAHTTGGDTSSLNYGVGYNFGQFAVGVERLIDKNNTNAAVGNAETLGGAVTTTTREEVTNMVGVTFNLDKNQTVGVLGYNTELKGSAATAASVKEKVRALQYGYNMGPVALSVTYSRFEGMNYTAGSAAEGNMGQVRLTTKF